LGGSIYFWGPSDLLGVSAPRTITQAWFKGSLHHCKGPGSSVGIEADYSLEGPESNLGGDENFRPSRPDLGPTQSPAQWVSGLSRGWGHRGHGADPSPHLVTKGPTKGKSYTSNHPKGLCGL